MKSLTVNQEIKIGNNDFKVVSLSVDYDDSEHPSFTAVRFIKSKCKWSTVKQSIRYSNIK